MSLHYLVKVEMLVKHVLPLSCYRRILQLQKFLPHLWPPYSPDLNPVSYIVWGLFQWKVYKILINDLDELKQRRSGPSWIMSSLQQPFVRSVFDSSSSVVCVLYTYTCNIYHILLSTEFKSDVFLGHS